MMNLMMLFTVAAATSAPASVPPHEVAIASVLDGFHDAASKADGVRYFGYFASSGVFIGTDATERWTVAEFKGYAQPYFSKGKGWTYVPRDRHIQIAPDGRAAWFDELLDNAKYGMCRGTGVLVREGKAWKLAQYHLTVPVPNDLMTDVVALIRAASQKPTKP